MRPRLGSVVTLRFRRPGRPDQLVTGTVLALFDDEHEHERGVVTLVPSVRIRAHDPALGGPEDVWEAPQTDVVSWRGKP